jgi:hypothetical protein
MKRNFFPTMGFLCLLFPLLSPFRHQTTDWEAEFNRMSRIVAEHEGEPSDSPKMLEPYLEWMENKARDRDEVKRLQEEVHRLSYLNPGDKELADWADKFFQLTNRAQESGIGTVNEACIRFMYVEDSKRPKDHFWRPVIARLRKDGRRIYQKAGETNFVSPMILGRARCMANFSIKDVESDSRGWGVYDGREAFFGYENEEGLLVMWDRDFEITCEPRGEFTTTSPGEPSKPTELGLDWIEEVRNEIKWWPMEREYRDATDLMNEFYKDSMCEVPWNGPDDGHRYFAELARLHELQESLEYNEDFYATLYGKVEIVTSTGRKPAAGAVVTVTAPNDGESWTGETDGDGRYEIEGVLLHKEYKPLEISARHGQDEMWDAFYGPLEEPDPSYRHEHNLEIRKGDLLCRISVGLDWIEFWDNRTTRHTGAATATVSGVWRYRPEKSTALAQFYEPEPLTVNYTYQELRHVKPSGNCPTLDWSLQDGGGATLPETEALTSLRILQMGPMGTVYELILPGTRLRLIQGKKRRSISEPDCHLYEAYSREVAIGHFMLLMPVGKNGEMSGRMSWTSTEGGMATNVGFGVRKDFSGNLHFSPKKRPHSPEKMVNINADWEFKKLKKNSPPV